MLLNFKLSWIEALYPLVEILAPFFAPRPHMGRIGCMDQKPPSSGTSMCPGYPCQFVSQSL